eukprot:366197-Chlamydomonas_euryale.AAC.7
MPVLSTAKQNHQKAIRRRIAGALKLLASFHRDRLGSPPCESTLSPHAECALSSSAERVPRCHSAIGFYTNVMYAENRFMATTYRRALRMCTLVATHTTYTYGAMPPPAHASPPSLEKQIARVCTWRQTHLRAKKQRAAHICFQHGSGHHQLHTMRQ